MTPFDSTIRRLTRRSAVNASKPHCCTSSAGIQRRTCYHNSVRTDAVCLSSPPSHDPFALRPAEGGSPSTDPEPACVRWSAGHCTFVPARCVCGSPGAVRNRVRHAHTRVCAFGAHGADHRVRSFGAFGNARLGRAAFASNGNHTRAWGVRLCSRSVRVWTPSFPGWRTCFRTIGWDGLAIYSPGFAGDGEALSARRNYGLRIPAVSADRRPGHSPSVRTSVRRS